MSVVLKNRRLRRIPGILAGFCLAPVSVSGGGVTIVTHGFNSNVIDWVIPMAGEMAGYRGLPANESSCYTLVVTEDPTAPAVWEGGKKPDLSPTGEIFIKLDWSAVDGFFGGRDSPEVAALAVAALLDPDLVPETGGRRLVELPLHLVGHSRGASVMSEIGRELGERGIWVDQVTFLDPQPAFGDAPVRVRTNVLYADNYWQTDQLPDGEFVPGAYNRFLTEFSGGYGSSHSDVHLWYFGTIDRTTPATSPEVDITQTMRDTWWTAAEDEGAATGYLYSRLAGGDRLGTTRPNGTDRVVDGYNQVWDLGAGVNANRYALSANSGAWPNVITCIRTGISPVAPGDPLGVDIRYQSGAGPIGEVTSQLLLDPDTNPWNGNEVLVDERFLPQTGILDVSATSVGGAVPMVPPGDYAVAVRLVDGGKARVLYAPGQVTVVESPPPFIDVDTMRVEGGVLRFTVRASPGQTLELQASGDLEEWAVLSTATLPSGIWEVVDSQYSGTPKRFYRVGEVE